MGVGAYFGDDVRFALWPIDQPPVCAMTYDGVTLTAAPWNFGYNRRLSALRDQYQSVHITMCDGIEMDIDVRPNVRPFSIYPSSVPAGSPGVVVKLVNHTGSRATATVADPLGTVISQGVIGSSAKVELHLDLSQVRTSTIFQVRVVADDGTVDSIPLPVTSGFATAPDWEFGHPPCSTLTWSYDPSGQPWWAARFKSDIQPALDLIAAESGLHFVESTDPSSALLKFAFSDFGQSGREIGGVSLGNGRIRFAKQVRYLSDGQRGLSPATVDRTTGKAQVSGRGWIIIHEVLHELGFTHVTDPASVMYPVAGSTKSLSAGDIDGLHTIYRDRCLAPAAP